LNLPSAIRPLSHLPPLWHMLHFPDTTPTIELSDDGAPRDMALLPPIDAPQILWAGADYTFHRPLAVSVATRRLSRVEGVEARQGSRGPMIFVTLEHCYLQGGEAHVLEHERIVFLDAALPGAAPNLHAGTALGPVASERRWPVNEALLFRFSALTFNALRIHYDQPYATGVAGYPGLVVHGPLQAMLLAETLRATLPHRPPRRAVFRARRPLFCAEDGVCVCTAAAPAAPDTERVLWTRARDGGVGMEARFHF
jgi:3-methylfumaryl-CoA hydratase